MRPAANLLLVEDDMNVATVLEARLQTFGHHVCAIVHTGPEAVRSALEHRPDLVLMDILLQGDMNGIEAAELIHNQIDVPIVFISCLRDRHILERAVKANAYGYILKPYDNAELRHTLQIALMKYRAGKERETLIEKLEQALAERSRAEEALLAANETLEQKVIERTRVEEARSKQLQALAVELIEVEERERRRISELLHDDLQQLMTATLLHLESVFQDLPHLPALRKVGQMLSDCITKARNLSHQLTPAVLYHCGLLDALEWLCRQLNEQFGLTVELRTHADGPIEDKPLQAFVIRAVRELLFNTIKHAGVKCARVVISQTARELIVTVSDEGQGFNPEILDTVGERVGLGLLSLRERASYIGGSLKVESAPGRGSRFTLALPLNLNAPEKRT